MMANLLNKLAFSPLVNLASKTLLFQLLQEAEKAWFDDINT
jgi:hypothetical protein